MNLLFYVILMVLSLAENMNEKMNVGMPGTSVSADVDVGASADVAVGASGEVAVAEAYPQTSGTYCTSYYGSYPSFDNAKNACNRDGSSCRGIYSPRCRKTNYRLCRSSGNWKTSSVGSCVFKKAAGTVEEEVGDCWKDCMGKDGNEDVCGKQCANAEEEVGDGDHYEELLEMRKTMTQMDYEFEAQKYMDAIKERERLEDGEVQAKQKAPAEKARKEEEEEEEAKQKEQEKSSSEDEESVNPEFSVGTGGYVNLEERTMSEKVFSFEGGVLVFIMGCIASGLYTIRCTRKKQDNEFHMLQEEL